MIFLVLCLLSCCLGVWLCQCVPIRSFPSPPLPPSFPLLSLHHPLPTLLPPSPSPLLLLFLLLLLLLPLPLPLPLPLLLPPPPPPPPSSALCGFARLRLDQAVRDLSNFSRLRRAMQLHGRAGIDHKAVRHQGRSSRRCPCAPRG